MNNHSEHVTASDDRSWRRPAAATSWQSSVKHCGSCPCSALNTSTASLNWAHWRTGSQCSCQRSGDMWSRHRAPVIRCAAEFWNWSVPSKRWELVSTPILGCSSAGNFPFPLRLRGRRVKFESSTSTSVSIHRWHVVLQVSKHIWKLYSSKHRWNELRDRCNRTFYWDQ